MAPYKRSGVFYSDISLNGRRYRQSLSTSDWRKAQQLERDLAETLKKQAALSVNAPQDFARLALTQALDHYIADREYALEPKTIRTERERSKQLKRQLGAIPVKKLTVADIMEYLRKRRSAGIAPGTINRELDLIRGVLKRARLWSLFADDIRPLKTTEHIGRALSHDEKTRLLLLAGSRPEWQTVYWATLLALNTTCRSIELKRLRWRDVDFLQREMTIRKSKTAAGIRVLPLNEVAFRVLLAIRSRAQRFNGTDPSHFVFCACEVGGIDPSSPQKSWRTAWRSLTRSINCPACGLLQTPVDHCRRPECRHLIKDVRSPLAGLRFHDLRHHAITELAESQTSDQTIMALAGHVSRKMLSHYSHIRSSAKKHALDALAKTSPNLPNLGDGSEGYDTKPVTKAKGAEDGALPVHDLSMSYMVELTGIEPVASSLRTRRSPS